MPSASIAISIAASTSYPHEGTRESGRNPPEARRNPPEGGRTPPLSIRARRQSAYLLALAAAAGVIDAASYLGLGRVFTANMTGNTVLLGIAVASRDGAAAARSAIALGGFCLGAAGAVAVIRARQPWPRAAAVAFVLETAALVALLVLWQALGADSARSWLIALSAIAMGAQSAAVRAADVRGVNTTYMTGTLVNAIARLVGRAQKTGEQAQSPSLPAGAWATYAVGALAGAFAERSWHAGAVTISLAIVGVVTVGALTARH